MQKFIKKLTESKLPLFELISDQSFQSFSHSQLMRDVISPAFISFDQSAQSFYYRQPMRIAVHSVSSALLYQQPMASSRCKQSCILLSQGSSYSTELWLSQHQPETVSTWTLPPNTISSSHLVNKTIIITFLFHLFQLPTFKSYTWYKGINDMLTKYLL